MNQPRNGFIRLKTSTSSSPFPIKNNLFQLFLPEYPPSVPIQSIFSFQKLGGAGFGPDGRLPHFSSHSQSLDLGDGIMEWRGRDKGFH